MSYESFENFHDLSCKCCMCIKIQKKNILCLTCKKLYTSKEFKIKNHKNHNIRDMRLEIVEPYNGDENNFIYSKEIKK